METLQYSNKLRDAMTKKQIKGKKEFLVFIGEVKICTGYLVGEVKCSLLRIFLQSQSEQYKSSQVLFLLKDIPSQQTKSSCHFFCTESWHFATNRFSLTWLKKYKQIQGFLATYTKCVDVSTGQSKAKYLTWAIALKN